MICTHLYHVGILVKDLGTAIADFEDLLGVTFREPKTATMPEMEMNGVVGPHSVTMTVSRQGPPYIELIQGQETGLWGLDQGEGVHHIGGWVKGTSLGERVDELEAGDHSFEGKVRRPTGDLQVGFLGKRHPDVHNVRFELITPGPVGGGLWSPEEMADTDTTDTATTSTAEATT